MYHNLDAEMARAKITRNMLAKQIGRTPTTLSLKLNGKAPLTLTFSEGERNCSLSEIWRMFKNHTGTSGCEELLYYESWIWYGNPGEL